MSSKSNTTQKTNQTQTVNQTTAPTVDPQLNEYYRRLMDMTNSALMGVDRSLITGPTKAGQNIWDSRALSGMESVLAALGPQVAPGTFTQNALNAASGMYLDPATNPTLTGMVDASMRPITEQLTRQILPGIDQNAIMDNAFGGDRVALARGQAVGDWAEASGDIASKIYYDNYNRERQIQLMAPELFAAGYGAEMMVPQGYAQMGDYQRGLDQIAIDSDLMRRALNEQIAFAGIPQAMSIFGAMPYVGQNTTGTTTNTGTTMTEQYSKANPLTSLIQGGLGIGSMLAGLGWQPFAAAGAGVGNSMLGGMTAGVGNIAQMLSMMPQFQKAG